MGEIRWSRLAIEDLQAPRVHIGEHDPLAAKRLAETIVTSIETLLSEHPEIGRPGRVAGTGELIIARTPYIVPYRVRAGLVQVLRVYHGARRWPTRYLGALEPVTSRGQPRQPRISIAAPGSPLPRSP